MIYDHMNSRFLSEEGVESFVLQFIEREAGSIYDYIDGVGVPGADQRLGKGKPRTDILVNDARSIWSSPWGRMLGEEELRDNTSRAAKKFRRRFRIPYSVFFHLVQRCKDEAIFGSAKIPVEFRLESTLASADETHVPFGKCPQF
jgi:hypothetical protein